MTTLTPARPAPTQPDPPDPFTAQLAAHAVAVLLADRSGLSVGVVRLRDGCLGLAARHVDDEDGTGPRLVVRRFPPSGISVLAYGPSDGSGVEVGSPLLVRADTTDPEATLADVAGMLTAWRRRQDEMRAEAADA
jgi:hypothetical protein